VNPKIIEKDEIKLIGMNFFGDPFKEHAGWSGENEIGKTWKRMQNVWSGEISIPNRIFLDKAMEVHLHNSETEKTGVFEVMVGVEVDKIESIPLLMIAKILPAGKYALFTLKGEEITSDWGYEIYENWLEKSIYKSRSDFNIQYYDFTKFVDLDDMSKNELDVLIPIIEK